MQRANAAAFVAQEHRVEGVARHEQTSTAKAKQSSPDNELEVTFKAARVEGMKGVAVKHHITAAEMKLRMIYENWEFYIAVAVDTSQGALELNLPESV